MRIWDIHPKYLCRAHLLGEHRELHAIWKIITSDDPDCGRAYRKHPEVMRWSLRKGALMRRHVQQIEEMERRGYNHASPLPGFTQFGYIIQDKFIDDIGDQVRILIHKPCACFSDGIDSLLDPQPVKQ